MKNLKLNLLLIVVTSFALSNCGGLSKMVENASSVSYEVTPSPLETHGGEVEITINTTFPEKYFSKKVVVTATPVLKYEGGQTAFESTTLQGESVEANNKVISYDGGSYSYTGKIPYEVAMLKSELVVEMSAQIKDKEPVLVPGIPVASGVIATPTLVQMTPQGILMGDEFQRVVPETYNSEILYSINKADVKSSETRKSEVSEFIDKVKSAKKDERTEIKSAKISSYASPDGEVDLNEKLSGNRGKSAEKYLSRTLKKLKVEEADADEFLQVVSTAEDWDGFKTLLQSSEIKDKELILRVLSMHSDPAVREKEIKNIAEAFKEIEVEVLPQLRRSQIMIQVDKIGFSDEELTELVATSIDTLNIEELLYAATLTEDNAQKLVIYEKASAKYPECFRAKNNVGYVQMELGNTAEAKAAFEASKAIKETNIAKNNLGAIALLEGDIVAAEELLSAATGAGDAVNYNLGIIKIKQGEYASAVNYFGTNASFNAALAQLCNKETDKALTTLDEVGDTDNKWVYYLKAVAGARASKEDVVIASLRLAIEKDSDNEIVAYALKDIEFANYVASEGFAALVK